MSSASMWSNVDDGNLMEAATALAELRKTHRQALGAASSLVAASDAPGSNAEDVPTGTKQNPSDTPLTVPLKGDWKFPMRMHALLADPTVTDAITWLPHGKSFVVIRPDILAARVLPLYFTHGSKANGRAGSVHYTSFTRRLNRWGYRQITHGPDSGAFWHELFRRDDPDACRGMVCATSRKVIRDADKSVSSASTMTSGSGPRPGHSAAITVSTSAVSLKSLPFKKRMGIVSSVPSKVEMKPNNTSLLARRTSIASINSYESGLDVDDGISTVSKESYLAPVNKRNATFPTEQVQAKPTAKATPSQYLELTQHTNVASVSNIASMQEAIALAKEALTRNFHEQYRAFALASLSRNSQLAMLARGMDVGSLADERSVNSPPILSNNIASYSVPLKQESQNNIANPSLIPATSNLHFEAANAAKSALYEAYQKALSS